MSQRFHRPQRGITLVELLMALVICALVIGPLAAMLATSVQAGMQNDSRARLQQDLRFALDRIGSAARETPRKLLSPQNTALSSTAAQSVATSGARHHRPCRRRSKTRMSSNCEAMKAALFGADGGFLSRLNERFKTDKYAFSSGLFTGAHAS